MAILTIKVQNNWDWIALVAYYLFSAKIVPPTFKWKLGHFQSLSFEVGTQTSIESVFLNIIYLFLLKRRWRRSDEKIALIYNKILPVDFSRLGFSVSTKVLGQKDAEQENFKVDNYYKFIFLAIQQLQSLQQGIALVGWLLVSWSVLPF